MTPKAKCRSQLLPGDQESSQILVPLRLPKLGGGFGAVERIDTQDEIPYSPAQKKEVYYVNAGQLGIVA